MKIYLKRIFLGSKENSLPNESGNGMKTGQFLDTYSMCNSPSANYYKPTEEPEPWELTQLNIEASIMCLVSKVKFLCGRCNSPAVRLRSQRSHSFRSNSSINQVNNFYIINYTFYVSFDIMFITIFSVL